MRRMMICFSMILVFLFSANMVQAEETDGSPTELVSKLEAADLYVQNGYLYEFDTLKLASEGKLLTCVGSNAVSTYLILNVPPAPDQDAAPGDQERGCDP